ncbi:MAG: hypothetical protein K5796_02615 [Lachnospiraceae bacterium]|nr:hypothetical protein [Lachnospiraceae bacterium]
MEKDILVEFVFSCEENKEYFKRFVDKEDVYICHILDSEYTRPEEELDKLSYLIACHKPSFYLIDSYYITADYCKAIYEIASKNSIKISIGYIDDLKCYDYPIDLVVNYDLDVNTQLYSAKKVLGGVEYAPLRNEFLGVDYDIRFKVARVFLSVGGTDPFQIIRKTYEYLYHNSYLVVNTPLPTFDIILGAYFTEEYKEQLLKISGGQGVVFHENVSDISLLMRQCDLAISAGGTSIYELCAIGVPTIAFGMSDNQIEFLKSFYEEGMIEYIGDIRTLSSPEKDIAVCYEQVRMNYGLRKQLSRNSRRMIDGKGAERIAESIIKYLEESEYKSDV